MNIVCGVFQVLHVCRNQHSAQLDEIAMLWIFNCMTAKKVVALDCYCLKLNKIVVYIIYLRRIPMNMSDIAPKLRYEQIYKDVELKWANTKKNVFLSKQK